MFVVAKFFDTCWILDLNFQNHKLVIINTISDKCDNANKVMNRSCAKTKKITKI